MRVEGKQQVFAMIKTAAPCQSPYSLALSHLITYIAKWTGAEGGVAGILALILFLCYDHKYLFLICKKCEIVNLIT